VVKRFVNKKNESTIILIKVVILNIRSYVYQLNSLFSLLLYWCHLTLTVQGWAFRCLSTSGNLLSNIFSLIMLTDLSIDVIVSLQDCNEVTYFVNMIKFKYKWRRPLYFCYLFQFCLYCTSTWRPSIWCSCLYFRCVRVNFNN